MHLASCSWRQSHMTVCTPALDEVRENPQDQEALSTFVSDVSSAIRSTFAWFPRIVNQSVEKENAASLRSILYSKSILFVAQLICLHLQPTLGPNIFTVSLTLTWNLSTFCANQPTSRWMKPLASCSCLHWVYFITGRPVNIEFIVLMCKSGMVPVFFYSVGQPH